MNEKKMKHRNSASQPSGKGPATKVGSPSRRSLFNSSFFIFHFSFFIPCLFFLLSWAWASWWMGDVLRIAYERSFFAANATLMHWLWQQSFGSLWIVGRALLTLYRWPLVGGLLVAVLLTAGSWLIGYCLRLPRRWRWAQYVPAGAWMLWTAWAGLDLFYMHEPGRILGIPFLALVVCAADAFVIWTFKRRRPIRPSSTEKDEQGKPIFYILYFIFILCLFSLPCLLLSLRHPYVRQLTHMQVQLMHEDYEGMSQTAHAHPERSYRPLAAYYAIALARTGHLTDQLFDIRLEFDTLRIHEYGGHPDQGMNYYLVDCDYQSGLIRPAMHRAMEELTMDGPSLFTLKHLIRMALIESDWALARKYMHVLSKVPFEGDFLARYEPMLDHPERVSADLEMSSIMKTMPITDAFENQFERPCFLGYFAVVGAGKTVETLNQSIMANLYSKRMPDFLARCQMFVGTTPPRSIAEGLITQSNKNPAILQAFPQLQMDAQRFASFIRVASPYMKDRERGGDELFEQYRGYFPYYYFFGNLRATRKADESKMETSKSGVN